MARKNIALLVGDIRDAYSSSVSRGAMRAAKENGCNLLIVPGRYFLAREELLLGEYEYQYQTLFTYFRNNNVDLIVLAAGAVGFVSGQKGRRSLDRFLMQIGNIPVLTISGDAKDIPNVRYDNATGIISGIEYLIGEQGCRKITFVAGPKENPDSDEREKAYMSVMEGHGLEGRVVRGDFTDNTGDIVYEYLREEPDTEAIVFANDRMALAGYRAAKKLGIKVGEDIAFVGFDNLDNDVYMMPPLATVYADACVLGRVAVEEALSYLKTGIVKDIVLPSRLILRGSIRRKGGPEITSGEFGYGFDEASDMETMIEDSFAYIYDQTDENERRDVLFEAYSEFIRAFTDVGRSEAVSQDKTERLRNAFHAMFEEDTCNELDLDRMIVIFESMERMISESAKSAKKRSFISRITSYAYKWLNAENAIRNIDIAHSRKKIQHEIYRISADMIGFDTITDETYASLLSNFGRFGIRNCYLFLFDQPIKNEIDDTFTPPKELCLKAILRKGKLLIPSKRGRLMPLEDIFSFVFEGGSERLVMLDLYIRNMIYGVIICDIPYVIFDYYESFNYQISSAVRTIRLLEENDENEKQLNESLELLTRNNIRLDAISKSDELTGVLNRRGFMTMGKAMLDEPKGKADAPRYIFVGYADVDGLKRVNDNYGHDDGDILIKSAAEALKASVNGRGIVGRIGGDEFATLMYADDKKIATEIEKDLNRRIEALNKDTDRPYPISVSFGSFIFPYVDDMKLSDLLDSADRKMYEIKAEHKSGRTD